MEKLGAEKSAVSRFFRLRARNRNRSVPVESADYIPRNGSRKVQGVQVTEEARRRRGIQVNPARGLARSGIAEQKQI